MNLVASLIVKDELSRFLPLAVEHLLGFVDELRVLDDGSTDGTYEWLISGEQVRRRVSAIRSDAPAFFEHEGRARQRLLEFTFDARPTHVLAIDADEFVSDGQALRSALEAGGSVWMPLIEEVWKADERCLYVRSDGGWKAHHAPIVYAVPEHRNGSWRILDRQLACGREPQAVRRRHREAQRLPVSILHFGWARESERVARYERYAAHDGGRFHASSHLRSILWPESRVRLAPRIWPASLPREELLAAVAR